MPLFRQPLMAARDIVNTTVQSSATLQIALVVVLWGQYAKGPKIQAALPRAFLRPVLILPLPPLTLDLLRLGIVGLNLL